MKHVVAAGIHKMKPPRRPFDSHQTKVYAAERAAGWLKDSKFKNLLETERFISEVMTSSFWRERFKGVTRLALELWQELHDLPNMPAKINFGAADPHTLRDGAHLDIDGYGDHTICFGEFLDALNGTRRALPSDHEAEFLVWFDTALERYAAYRAL